MENKQIRLILQGIDFQIEEVTKKLNELKIAREAFRKQNREALVGYEGFKRNSSKIDSGAALRRLAQGTPKRWVIDALEKCGKSSAAELNQFIHGVQGQKLASGTLWRVLKELKESGKARNNLEDATWEMKVEDDDGLPF